MAIDLSIYGNNQPVNVGQEIAQQQAAFQAQQAQRQQMQMQSFSVLQARQDWEDQQKMRSAYQQSGGDLNKTMQLATAAGVSPKGIQGLQEYYLGVQKKYADLAEVQSRTSGNQLDQHIKQQHAEGDALMGSIQDLITPPSTPATASPTPTGSSSAATPTAAPSNNLLASQTPSASTPTTASAPTPASSQAAPSPASTSTQPAAPAQSSWVQKRAIAVKGAVDNGIMTAARASELLSMDQDTYVHQVLSSNGAEANSKLAQAAATLEGTKATTASTINSTRIATEKQTNEAGKQIADSVKAETETNGQALQKAFTVGGPIAYENFRTSLRPDLQKQYFTGAQLAGMPLPQVKEYFATLPLSAQEHVQYTQKQTELAETQWRDQQAAHNAAGQLGVSQGQLGVARGNQARENAVQGYNPATGGFVPGQQAAPGQALPANIQPLVRNTSNGNRYIDASQMEVPGQTPGETRQLQANAKANGILVLPAGQAAAIRALDATRKAVSDLNATYNSTYNGQGPVHRTATWAGTVLGQNPEQKAAQSSMIAAVDTLKNAVSSSGGSGMRVTPGMISEIGDLLPDMRDNGAERQAKAIKLNSYFDRAEQGIFGTGGKGVNGGKTKGGLSDPLGIR